MTLLTCAAVRRRLAAFHDRELPVGEQIAIEAHLHDCPPLRRRAARAADDRRRRCALAAAPAPSDDWTGPAVRRDQPDARRGARVAGRRASRRMFDDMHLVWIGLASTAATFLCGAIVLGMLHFASPERDDSLAARDRGDGRAVGLGPEPGAARRPASRRPSTCRERRHRPGDAGRSRRRRTRAGAGAVGRSSRAKGGSTGSSCSATITTAAATSPMLLDAISRGRLEPAQLGGATRSPSTSCGSSRTPTVKGDS